MQNSTGPASRHASTPQGLQGQPTPDMGTRPAKPRGISQPTTDLRRAWEKSACCPRCPIQGCVRHHCGNGGLMLLSTGMCLQRRVGAGPG